MVQSITAGMVIGLLTATGACGTPRNDVVRNDASNQGTAMTSASDMPAPPGGQPVNQRFAKLDDYLSWLRETQAPVGKPFYEEIRPGVYQMRTGNLRVLVPEGEDVPGEQTFTRVQLLKKFGFSS